MKRLYCKHEFKYYTFLKEIMLDLDLVDKDYWWLISDIEAYPRRSETKELLNQNSHLLLTAKELVEILEKDDFQWIWAVFSVIPFEYQKEDILKYDLPYVEIGADSSEFKLVITPTNIQFKEGALTPASISNETMIIENARIKQSLQIGTLGFVVRGNGHISLMPMGVI